MQGNTKEVKVVFNIYEFYEYLTNMNVGIRLDAGDPDLPPPLEVIKVLKTEINKLGYAPSSGIRELKEKIAEFHGVDLNEVVVTPGAKAAIAALIHVLGKMGLIAPYWPGYLSAIRLFNKEKIVVYTRQEDQWLPKTSWIEELAPKVNALIINYPHNPTGIVPTKTWIKELIDIADDNDLVIVSDEAYRDLNYTDEKIVLAELRPTKTVSIYSFSKTFSLPGLRIGYAVGDPELISKIREFIASTYTSIPVFSQLAALKALEIIDSVAKRARNYYYDKLRKTIAVINKKLFDYVEPRGGFYLFLRIKKNIDGVELAYKLAERGIGVFPGVAFGGDHYSKYIRVSLTAPIQDIVRAFKTMEALLE